jgi:hypothetical protein
VNTSDSINRSFTYGRCPFVVGRRILSYKLVLLNERFLKRPNDNDLRGVLTSVSNNMMCFSHFDSMKMNILYAIDFLMMRQFLYA